MRFTFTLAFTTFTSLTALALAGCPGGGGDTTGTGPGTTSVATDATGGTSVGATEPLTTGSSATSTTALGTSTEAGTSTGGSGSTAASSSTGSGTGSTTGGVGGGACQVDADCQLHNDCCDCYGEPVDAPGPLCELRCDQPMCDAIGIKQAVCRFGQCATEKLQCSGEVACDSLPPDCPKGTLPGISGVCWSGACVPVASCDAVPDCALCPSGTMCVEYQALPSMRVCEPIPAGCEGDPSCACAGDLACVDPFGICHDGAMGEVVCECPTC